MSDLVLSSLFPSTLLATILHSFPNWPVYSTCPTYLILPHFISIQNNIYISLDLHIVVWSYVHLLSWYAVCIRFLQCPRCRITGLENHYILLYAFFGVIPRRLNFVSWRFRTLCLFHLHRQVVVWRMNEPPACEDGTNRVFRNVGTQNSDAGE